MLGAKPQRSLPGLSRCNGSVSRLHLRSTRRGWRARRRGSLLTESDGPSATARPWASWRVGFGRFVIHLRDGLVVLERPIQLSAQTIALRAEPRAVVQQRPALLR
eukprot:scaffold4504_cov116-Isochrysis_galbana.AAC.9